MTAPALPEDATASALDAAVRRDLRGLQKDTAETVARHLVAAGTLVDEDPQQALEHARYARQRASRIAVVREAAGIAAYHAGEWAEALNDLRAARRMGGGPGHLAVMADIERALGRPERALDLARDPEVDRLDPEQAVELKIVAAGARRDLGELDAAVVALQIPELDPARREPWSARLFYAYADNLLAAGREAEAVQWFVHAADADDEGRTDADERLAELTGEPLDVLLEDEADAEAEDGGSSGDAADDGGVSGSTVAGDAGEAGTGRATGAGDEPDRPGPGRDPAPAQDSEARGSVPSAPAPAEDADAAASAPEPTPPTDATPPTPTSAEETEEAEEAEPSGSVPSAPASAEDSDTVASAPDQIPAAPPSSAEGSEGSEGSGVGTSEEPGTDDADRDEASADPGPDDPNDDERAGGAR